MASNVISDEEYLAVVEAVQRLGNKQAAANELGLHVNTLKNRYNVAIRRNLTGSFLGPKLPDGYVMGKVTSLVGQDGTSLEWQHKHPTIDAVESAVEDILEKFQSDVPRVELLPPPVAVNDKLLTLYPVPDLHLGMYAWAKESGDNYDIHIAGEHFRTAFQHLFAATPASDTAVILGLGDYFHADNNDARTPRSGNPLAVDGRFDKVLHFGAELFIWAVDLALQKHRRVVVRVLRGNHDPYAARALALALFVRYINDPRVEVDRDPGYFWKYEWGKTMLAATHGDETKPEEMPGVMAAYWPEMWGRTVWRYAFTGHVHKRKKGPYGDEHHGAVYEILPSPAAKDDWNRSQGHSSGRALVAITYDKDAGEFSRVWATITG